MRVALDFFHYLAEADPFNAQRIYDELRAHLGANTRVFPAGEPHGLVYNESTPHGLIVPPAPITSYDAVLLKMRARREVPDLTDFRVVQWQPGESLKEAVKEAAQEAGGSNLRVCWPDPGPVHLLGLKRGRAIAVTLAERGNVPLVRSNGFASWDEHFTIELPRAPQPLKKTVPGGLDRA